jgi:hypothetical protein
MALGLSASMTFVHVPFVKIGGFPLTAYRMLPGSVYKGLRRPLGLKMHAERFRDPAESMRALDRCLAEGRPVGLQTSVYWLPYFPPEMRFHFNAHNIVVYGKEGDEYLVSDPVFDRTQRCSTAELLKARYANGAFAPKGLLYYPISYNKNFALEPAVRSAIKRTVNMMLRAPMPFVGLRAIRGLAKKIRKLPHSHPDARYQRLYVGNIVRMQEEIGTGGGGFRFMYAAFLQEAGQKLGNPLLLEAAQGMTQAGDTWRQFALLGAQFSRQKEGVDVNALADQLLRCAEKEESVYRQLRQF